jgi:hypothetical protein
MEVDACVQWDALTCLAKSLRGLTNIDLLWLDMGYDIKDLSDDDFKHQAVYTMRHVWEDFSAATSKLSFIEQWPALSLAVREELELFDERSGRMASRYEDYREVAEDPEARSIFYSDVNKDGSEVFEKNGDSVIKELTNQDAALGAINAHFVSICAVNAGSACRDTLLRLAARIIAHRDTFLPSPQKPARRIFTDQPRVAISDLVASTTETPTLPPTQQQPKRKSVNWDRNEFMYRLAIAKELKYFEIADEAHAKFPGNRLSGPAARIAVFRHAKDEGYPPPPRRR